MQRKTSPFSKLKNKLNDTGGHAGIDPVMRPASFAENKDVLGAYPTAVRVPALESRRYLWTTRVFAIAFYLSMIFNIVLVITLYTLFPLKRVEPMLVTFNSKDQQVVHIEPFAKTVAGLTLFTEQQAGEYVKMREEIVLDVQEQQRRWVQYLKFRMNEDAYSAFLNRVNEPYQQLTEKGVSRAVAITRIQRRSADHIEVSFTTTDFDRLGNKILENNWLAHVRIGYTQMKVNSDEQYYNPMGFTVFDYSVVQN